MDELKKKIEVTPFALTVTPLVMFKDNCRMGTATGFFYSFNNKIFLITNKHCVIDKEKQYYPNKIIFEVHTDANDISKNINKELNLYNGNKPRWLEHTKKKIDIIGIEISQDVLKGCIIKAFNKENFPPEDLILEIGEDLLVLGYPLGFYDTMHNLPIVRNASISSNYGINFKGNRHFLIDSNLHPGTSGSPVITKPSTITRSKTKGTVIGGWVSHLVGINSGSYEPLGLNIVWYVDLLEEIVKGESND